MLTEINVVNYKAFDNACIPIKPITILLGANSVGKSSIIQLLLLLQQTGKEDIKSYKSALKLYGGNVNLGDSVNLFRMKDTNNTIDFNFKLSSALLKNQLKEELLSEYAGLVTSIVRYIPVKTFLEMRHKTINSRADFSAFIDLLTSLMDKDKKIKTMYADEIKWILSMKSDSLAYNLDDLSPKNKSNLLKAYDYLSNISQCIKNKPISINYSIKYCQKKLCISHIAIGYDDKKIVEFDSSESISLKSDFITFEPKDIDDVNARFERSNTLFNIFKKRTATEQNFSTISNIVVEIINIVLTELRKEFGEERINYVSPLRAHPKRYYMLDKAKINLTLDTLDGDAIADVLKDNTILKNKVNKWLETFKLSISVEAFKEVVHHLKVKQNNLSLDITDVGFGISQVLPVIIQGFLSPKDSTTIIEQPEIHLHPKMQADLADLFIDIVNGNRNNKLIIETHSEYLLKRLRRRISEGVIKSEDVSICLFNPQSGNKGAYVENIHIEKKGYFKWPIDFYDGELLRDTTEFLINQK